MLLQSDIFLPMGEAFKSGTLEMSSELPDMVAATAVRWGEYPLNAALLVVSAFLLAFSIPSFYKFFPNMAKTFSRWRWNFTIESNMQLCRMRDTLSVLMILPSCLVADRYGLFTAARLSLCPAKWHVLAILAIFLAFYLLRSIMYLALQVKARASSAFVVARKSERTWFYILVFVILIGVAVFEVFGAADSSIRLYVIIASMAVYLLFFLNKAKILGSSCNPFATFLYLCGLEILPVGILIAANALL